MNLNIAYVKLARRDGHQTMDPFMKRDSLSRYFSHDSDADAFCGLGKKNEDGTVTNIPKNNERCSNDDDDDDDEDHDGDNLIDDPSVKDNTNRQLMHHFSRKRYRMISDMYCTSYQVGRIGSLPPQEPKHSATRVASTWASCQTYFDEWL